MDKINKFLIGTTAAVLGSMHSIGAIAQESYIPNPSELNLDVRGSKQQVLGKRKAIEAPTPKKSKNRIETNNSSSVNKSQKIKQNNNTSEEIKPNSRNFESSKNLCKKLGDGALIDLTKQSVLFCDNGTKRYQGPVSTGKSSSPTRKGIFQVNYVENNARLRGGSGSDSWDVKVDVFAPFDGDIGLHNGQLPGYPASHGCVRTLRDAVPAIRSLKPGDTVAVFGESTKNATFKKLGLR
jgi:lipoprotein-anchoring transpeptidase ErfK/SrfK